MIALRFLTPLLKLFFCTRHRFILVEEAIRSSIMTTPSDICVLPVVSQKPLSDYNAAALSPRIGRQATWRLAAKLFLAAIILVCGFSASAQTAHFSEGFSTLPASGLSSSFSVAVDAGGNVYIADTGNNRVLKETWQGNGSYTQSVVTTSTLSSPKAVAVDANGVIYVADTMNSRVLKETPAVSDGVTTYTESIVASYGGNALLYPSSIAVDSNLVVYIVSFGNNVALKMTPNGSGGYGETLLGQGLSQLYGIAVDANLNVYLADYNTGTVYEAPWTGSAYGACSAIQTGLSKPTALAVDASGNIYVADSGHNRIWKDTPTSTAGAFTGSSFLGSLNNPLGVAVDAAGNLAIANSGGKAVLRETQAGVNFGQVGVASAVPAQAILTFTFDSGGSITTAVATQGDWGLDFTNSGMGSCNTNGASHIYSAGDTCTVIPQLVPRYSGARFGAVLIKSSNGIIATGYLQGTGVGPQITFLPSTQKTVSTHIQDPVGVVVDSSGDLFTYDSSSGYVDRLLSSTGYASVGRLVSGIGYASGIALDGAGNVFISTQMNEVIEIPVASSLVTTLPMQSAFIDLNGLAVDGSGNIYVADFEGSAVYEILAASGYNSINSLGSGFPVPTEVAVDSSGNAFVLQYNLNMLNEMVAVNGVISTTSPYIIPLSGDFRSNPTNVALDGNGNVYVAAGNTVKEFLTVGGFQTKNTFDEPIELSGVAVDGRGNIFVTGASGNSGYIYETDIADPPSLTFRGTSPGTNSAEQTVTVTNAGNAPLTIASINISTNFDIDASAASSCQAGVQIAAGAKCTLSVYFSPTSTGTQSGQLILTDNALNAAPATQIIALSGFDQTPQTITFPSNQSTSVTGSYCVRLLATASSGLPVAFSVVSGPGIITSSSNLVFTAPGTVVVAADQAGNSTYAAAPTVTISITMNLLNQFITFNQLSSPVTYGVRTISLTATTNMGLPVTFTVLSGPGSITGLGLTISGTGTVVVAANQAGDVAISAAPQITQSVVVNPAAQTINFPQPTSPVTYGAPVALGATASSKLTVSYSVLSGPATVSGSTLITTGVGTVVVAATQAGNTNYNAATQVTRSITVNPAMLTVTASSPSIIYGAPLPTYIASITGYVNQDSSAVISGAPTLSISPAAPSAAGSYRITVGKGSLMASNYTFALVNGTLTIGKAAATVSGSPAKVTSGQAVAIPVTFTGPYAGAGIALPSGTASYTIVNEKSALVSGTLTLMGGASSVFVPKTLPSGNYAINISYGGGGNYGAATGTIALTVTPASQTITFTPLSAPVTYGNSPITLSATASSGQPVSFNLISGPATLSGSTLTITGAGTVIVAANQAGNSAYTAAPQATESIVVKPAVLTVVASSPSIAYGAKLPTYAAVISGYVNKDTSRAVSGAPTLTTSPAAPSAVGLYPITVGKGTLAAANYTFALVNGNLTITKAPLTITATSVSVAYNLPLPKLAYAVAGFMNNDTLSVLSGAPAESTTAKQGSTPGAYPITIAQGALAAANYGFQFQNGALKVTSLGTAASPVFTLAAGTYSSSQTVKITAATPGSVIYYTINGTPTASSTLYTSAGIKVSATETIEALAIAPGYSNSASAVATYTIATAPAVTTAAATGLSASGVTLNGLVSAKNATTQYWFVWGISKSALTNATTKTGALTGTNSNAVSAKLTGLKTKTIYYYQSLASNAAGSTSGTVLSFTTN
jgi:sugar lactone lactonase YvrE